MATACTVSYASHGVHERRLNLHRMVANLETLTRPHHMYQGRCTYSIVCVGSLFPAALIPGAALEDHPGSLPRVLGMPLNLFVAGLTILVTVLGYWWYWRQEGKFLREGEALFVRESLGAGSARR